MVIEHVKDDSKAEFEARRQPMTWKLLKSMHFAKWQLLQKRGQQLMRAEKERGPN
jgi:hypothetical protein